MKYSILTFGCRVNQADSMDIERELRQRGGRPVSSAHADLIVVNSCSVTATADQGTRQAIRRVARENPDARIVVTGCYATRCPDELAALPSVVAVVPNDRKEWLASEAMTTAERFAGADGPCGAPFLLDRTALTIRVQTGCEERCSYCIIPTTRGASRSKPVAGVVEELSRAESSGFLEVTLTGVHLGAYGRDLDPPAQAVGSSRSRRPEHEPSLDTTRIAGADGHPCVACRVGVGWHESRRRSICRFSTRATPCSAA